MLEELHLVQFAHTSGECGFPLVLMLLLASCHISKCIILKSSSMLFC